MKYIVLLSILCTATVARGQKTFSITEKDPDEKEFIVTRTVDIGSQLSIKFDKDKLRSEMLTSGNYSMPKELTDMIARLTSVMQKEKEVLDKFHNTLLLFKSNDPSAEAQFKTSMQEVAKFVRGVFKTDPIVQQYYNEDPSADLIAPAFRAVERRITELQTKALSDAAPGVTLRFGAWLVRGNVKAPLHLDKFDQLPQGEYYEVDRFRFLPTEAQLQELRDLQALAKENRDKGLAILETSLKNYTSVLEEQMKDKFSETLRELEAAATAIGADIITAGIDTKLAQLRTHFTDAVRTLRGQYDFYKAIDRSSLTDPFALMNRMNSDVQALNNATARIKTDLTDIHTAVSGLADALKPKFATLKSLIETKLAAFRELIAKPESIKELLTAAQLDASTFEFSEKILKLSFDSFPTETNLNLNTTGKREAGDRLMFIVQSTETGKATPHTIDSKEISLQRLAFHFEGKVGVVFAHPFESTQIKTPFQMAPYYNLLFKGLWPWTSTHRRKTQANAGIWDLSWGLHVSTPDFNKDDVPEIGAGLVISGIKDIVQLGIAHNLFEGKSYWFFGLRIPMPFLNAGTNGNGGEGK